MANAQRQMTESQAQTFEGRADQPIVIVVDDDDSMRSALRRLLASARLTAELYASGTEFLAEARLDRPGCLLLDVGMPDMSGIEVQARLKQRSVTLPVIFLTGSSDIPIAVSAMREGAVDFIEKPFDNDDLLARVRKAIDRHAYSRQEDAERQNVLHRLNALTVREHSVLKLIVAGQTNKEIARSLGVSHRTIEIHRRHIMKKMAAPTLADLVRMSLGDNNLSAERRDQPG
jgi:FixJ family two-component response regulator